MVSKQKNRHIKLFFGVYIHALVLFVWCISIIKYIASNAVVISLHRVYLWCVDVVSSIEAQILQHNSLGDIKASVLFVKQQKGSRPLNQLPLQDLGFLPPNKMYENVILSNLSADTAMLCEHEFIITTLNEEKMHWKPLWENL